MLLLGTTLCSMYRIVQSWAFSFIGLTLLVSTHASGSLAAPTPKSSDEQP